LGKYRKAVKYMPFSGNFCDTNVANIIFDSNVKCQEISVEKVIAVLKNSLEKK
jgi:hypothetical protein